MAIIAAVAVLAPHGTLTRRMAFLAILVGFQQALVLMLGREDPDLLEERMEG